MAANLSVTLKLIDQMSQKLESIASGGDRVANNFNQLGRQADDAFNKATSGSQKVSEAMNSATNATDGYAASSNQAQEALEKQGEASEKAGEDIKKMGEESEEAGKKGQESSEKGQKAAMDLGDALVAAGIVVALKEITAAYFECDDAADQFEAAMAKVSTIADTTAVSMGQMHDDIVKLSQDTGQSVNDLSESVYSAISASVDTADAVNFVAQANALAVGGFTQSATAVDILTTTINAYGMSAEQAAEISDKLINTQNLGKTTVDELASSMGMVIPTAAAFGVSLDNLTSAYVTLTRNGINTANATTMLNGMFSELADEGKAVSKVLQQETGKSFAELMEEGKNLGDVMAILGESVNGDSVAFMNLWSNVRAGRGAVNIFNAGAEEFANVMDSMANSAGSATEAFEKMTDTGQYVEQKWQNALENFKIAIGDAAPSLDGLMEQGTKILDFMSEFVTKHPSVVAGITAMAVALGSFTAVMTLYSAGTLLAQKATMALTAAMDVNPIFLAITAIAALTAGIVVFVSSLEDWEFQDNRLTAASQDLSNRIEDQKKVVADLEKQYGSMDKRTLEAKAKLEELEAEFEQSGQTIGEFKRQIQDTADAVAESTAKYDEAISAIGDQNEHALVLITELERLSSASNLTAFQQEYEKQVVSELSEMYPELADAYDEVTGQLNMSTSSLRRYCEQKKEEIKLEQDAATYLEYMEEMAQYTAEMETAQQNLTSATEEYNRQMEALGNTMTTVGGNDMVSASITSAKSAMDDAQNTVNDLTEKMDDLQQKMDALEGNANGAADGIEGVADASQDAAAQMEEFQKSLTKLLQSDDFQKELEKIVDDIKGMYEGLQSTVSSSVGGLFDPVEMEVKHSGEEIKGALESQTEYLNNYKENLDQLNRLGFSDEFKQSFATGSKESAEELQGLINTIEKLEEHGESVSAFVLETQQAFDDMQEAEKTLTDTLADMNLEIKNKLAEAKTLVEEGIGNLNLEGEASKAAKDTMDAYVREIEAGARSAKAAIQTVASAVSAAMRQAESYASSGGKVKGNAAGTTYGEDVYIAGEYGPELIVGRKGSEVFPATETAKILNAVMNLRENKADVEMAPAEITNNIIQTTNSTNTNNENRNITLTIKGKGSLDIGQSVSRKDLHAFISDELEVAIASILQKEMYEEGAFAYEF